MRDYELRWSKVMLDTEDFCPFHRNWSSLVKLLAKG